MFMFGRKEAQKRSLEDMFASRDEVSEFVEEGSVSFEFKGDKEEIVDATVDKASLDQLKPFDFFGMEEGKSEKWLMNCVKFWYCLMSFLWFLLGAVTFAPVLYISNNVNVIFKDKKKSLLCAVLIHAIFIALIFVFFTIR
jgi:hypothetical protein